MFLNFLKFKRFICIPSKTIYSFLISLVLKRLFFLNFLIKWVKHEN